MAGNTTCNANVIDLTGGSDDERIESARNNSGGMRRPHQQSRQARKSNDIEVINATIQMSCKVCLKKFETIKSEGANDLLATIPCGHIFCRSCILMLIKTRTKYLQDGTKYINCPTCSGQLPFTIISETYILKLISYHPSFLRIHL